jgi:WD40 repeat protein
VAGQREPQRLFGCVRPITSLAYHPDGHLLAAGCEDGSVKIWQLPRGEVVQTLDDHSDRPVQLEFSPDGTRLATLSLGDGIRIWDLSTGQTLHKITPKREKPLCLGWNGMSTAFAVGFLDGKIAVWDAALGTEKLSFQSAGWVNCLAFSPDGQSIAAATRGDNHIYLWNARNGARRAILGGHTATPSYLKYSSNGMLLASGAADGSARIWDATGAEQGEFPLPALTAAVN